ncbi:MAG: glycosyltransferase family 4 protein, partial [Akkermansiaceae bacterium]|nr:glycosyltransferase family 4 protein [Verrucomicrobiales bacterium]
VCKVLYLAHCMREKGLFDAISGVRLANRALRAQGSALLLHLTVAGNFVTAQERAEFDSILAKPDAAGMMHYAGFISGPEKERLLRESDLFCFPTFYPNENQPVNLIEAMAYGLPVITTRWRSLAEMFPENYPGLVDIQSPEQVSAALQRLLRLETGQTLRRLFVQNFTLQSYLSGLAKAFQSVKRQDSPACLETGTFRS